MYPTRLPSELLQEDPDDMDDQMALDHRYGIAYYLIHKPGSDGDDNPAVQ